MPEDVVLDKGVQETTTINIQAYRNTVINKGIIEYCRVFKIVIIAADPNTIMRIGNEVAIKFVVFGTWCHPSFISDAYTIPNEIANSVER